MYKVLASFYAFKECVSYSCTVRLHEFLSIYIGTWWQIYAFLSSCRRVSCREIAYCDRQRIIKTYHCITCLNNLYFIGLTEWESTKQLKQRFTWNIIFRNAYWVILRVLCQLFEHLQWVVLRMALLEGHPSSFKLRCVCTGLEWHKQLGFLAPSLSFTLKSTLGYFCMWAT